MTTAVPEPDLRPTLVPAISVRGTHGVVTSPHSLASQAGLATLKSGGNAVDAAIATNAALAVVSSFMCGLGGDAFWLIWTERDGLRALNGSGRSAAAATLDAARAVGLERMPIRGPWTVTVPGAIRSWGDAHRRYGRLPWPALFGPAVELAGSFPASPAWTAAVERGATVFGADSDWARVFRPERRAWRTGEIVRLPAIERTLRRLAAEGPAVAYEGELGRRGAGYLESRGSLLRPEDFASHTSTWADPIRGAYRGIEAASHPPNSSGAVALELLHVLDALGPPDPAAFGPHGISDPRWVHFQLEAARLAIADRDAHLSDLETMAPGALEHLLDRGYAGRLAARIDPRRALPLRPVDAPAAGGTIYLAVVDAEGTAVSLIESNYMGFGSGLVDPETGIAYQNRGAFFSLDPDHANVLAPGKRTMHTLMPGMLFRDGRPWIVHGSMGGEIQPQVFAQFVSAVVDGRRSIADAVAAPRFAADADAHYAPLTLSRLEDGMLPEVGAVLSAMGHEVVWSRRLSGEFGHEHAIELVYRARGDDEARGPGDGRPEAGVRHGAGPSDERVPATRRIRPTSFVATADPRSEGLPAAW